MILRSVLLIVLLIIIGKRIGSLRYNATHRFIQFILRLCLFIVAGLIPLFVLYSVIFVECVDKNRLLAVIIMGSVLYCYFIAPLAKQIPPKQD